MDASWTTSRSTVVGVAAALGGAVALGATAAHAYGSSPARPPWSQWRRLVFDGAGAPCGLPGDFPVTARAIRRALKRIAPFVHRTPVTTSASLDAIAGRRVFFKCEVLQRTGSFKIRGATHASLRAVERAPGAPLVTHSSGNHAQALALAARSVGVAAHIVMPRTAPAVKKAAVLGYGGIITECEPTNAARAAAAEALVREVSGTFVHPSDDVDVICGQGTVACEFLDDVPFLDVLVVPVGGGGLISGIAAYAKTVRPDLIIVGAEPANVDDAKRSKDAGRLIADHAPGATTIADGLKTLLGRYTWPVVDKCVDEIITVDEEAIADATKLVWSRMKLCIEPSAGVGVAVLLGEEFQRKYDAATYPNVGVILCGGNMDLAKAATTLFAAKEAGAT